MKKNYLNEIEKTKKTINLIPYSQIKEKWYKYNGKDLPIMSLLVEDEFSFEKDEFYDLLNGEKIELEHWIISSVSDEEYAEWVKRMIKDEIMNWEWPNFLYTRKFFTKIKDFNQKKVLYLFKNLLKGEENSYMSFVFFDWSRYQVWASIELHLSIKDGYAQMNPISWSLPKKNIDSIYSFLEDQKEINELFHSVDEELKMMAVICEKWWVIKWPFLKEMNSLIHTEYYLIGESTLDPIDALRESLFACTVTWWPIENACRIISKYEKDSRRYYAWVLALFDWKDLDSTILIRTVEIDKEGNLTYQVGASIVLDSDPFKEAIETRAKAEGILKAIDWTIEKFSPKLQVIQRDFLEKRNKRLSKFLLNKQQKKDQLNYKILTINNWDNFTYTLSHFLKNMWNVVNVVNRKDFFYKDEDIVIIGPWPGNPNQMPDLISMTEKILKLNCKVIGICLWHQAISKVLGYEVVRKDSPTQWIALDIEVFWKKERFGFYNSFAPIWDEREWIKLSKTGKYIDVLKTGNIYSMQFHPESILSENGYKFLLDILN